MKVKSKVRMGAAASLLLCASLASCSGSCVSNLGVCAGGRSRGAPGAPGWATRGFVKARLSSSPVGSAGSWKPGGSPPLPARHLQLGRTGFKLTIFCRRLTQEVGSSGGSPQLSSPASLLFFFFFFRRIPLSQPLIHCHVIFFFFSFKESFFWSLDPKWSRASLSAGNWRHLH